MSAMAFAQAPAMQANMPTDTAAAATSSAQPNPDDNSTYATGQPLQPPSKEGFWGHMNPFARKKWVNRSLEPIRERDNELDQLQAKNAKDIKDVDARAQAGINQAMMAANTADQHAAAAAQQANAAQSTANGASQHAQSLNGTVSNLDQYQSVVSTDVKFARGRTTLGPQGKTDLDDMASKLANEKGYIIEVQGYSKSGVASSQAMADSVVRYLVTEHQVPIYRIYRTGLGKAQTEAANAAATSTATTTTASTADQEPLTNGVRVTLLHNSLAAMNSTPGAAPSNQ